MHAPKAVLSLITIAWAVSIRIQFDDIFQKNGKHIFMPPSSYENTCIFSDSPKLQIRYQKLNRNTGNGLCCPKQYPLAQNHSLL